LTVELTVTLFKELAQTRQYGEITAPLFKKAFMPYLANPRIWIPGILSDWISNERWILMQSFSGELSDHSEALDLITGLVKWNEPTMTAKILTSEFFSSRR
jgi:hypothetical protein